MPCLLPSFTMSGPVSRFTGIILLALVINSVYASTVLAVYNSLSTFDKACAPRAHCAASAFYYMHFGVSSMQGVLRMMSWRLSEDILPKALRAQYWSATHLQSKVGVPNACLEYGLILGSVQRIIA